MEIEPTSDGSRTLYSPRYRQTFHSRHGAATEARHVFLAASGVAELLADGRGVSVLEVGFGSGLNFFVSAEAVRAEASLRYVALEQQLLSADLVARLGYREQLRDPAVLDDYLRLRRALPRHTPPGRYRLRLSRVAELQLRIGDAARQRLEANAFDAIYLDGFSPEANPELWSSAFLAKLAQALKPGGRLVTYSVKGEVRRRLAALGLEVAKRPGPPGGKREMLAAEKRTADNARQRA